MIPGLTEVGNPLSRVREIFLEILQDAFQNPHLFSENGNPFLFIVDAAGNPTKESKISIASTYSKDNEKDNPRPAILVNRDAVRFNESTIDHSQDFGYTKNYSHTRQTQFDTMITVDCFGRGLYECESIAWVVGGILLMFRDVLAPKYNMGKMSAPSISTARPSEVDAMIDLFQCTVSITLMMPYRWVNTYLLNAWKLKYTPQVQMTSVSEGPTAIVEV